MTQKKFYKPELVKAPSLNIPSEDTKTSPLHSLKEGEVIKVKLDNDVGVQRFSHDIYSSWTSGVRELYNNEARACRTTMNEHPNVKPEIHITINPLERQLVIEGRNSQGISMEIFQESLSVLGVSSNFDGNEVGQFGMGFASYTTLFEEMIMETYSRETNEKYSALADSGVEFKILPTPKIKTYGTKLSGTYTDKVNEDKMIDGIKEYARFSGVPTFIELTEDTDHHSAGLIMCDVYEDGQAYLKAMVDEHFEEGRKSIKSMKNIRIDNDDYTFDAFLMTYDSGYGNIYKWDMSEELSVITLVGTPIIADVSYKLQRAVSGYILNIKDERKYSPTADRDRMKEDSMETIEAEILEKLTEEYQEYILKDIEDYKQRVKDGRGWFYSSDVWNDVNTIVDDETTDEIVSTLNRSYTTAPSKYYESLLNLMNKEKYKGMQIIALKGLRKSMMEKLDSVFPDGTRIYIRLPTRDETELETSMRVMRELGIVIGEEYIREHNIKAKRRKNGEVANVPVRMYSHNARGRWGGSSWGKDWCSKYLFDVNDNAHKFMMRVDKDNFETVKAHNYYCSFVVMRDKKNGYDNKIKTYPQHMKEIENTLFNIKGEQKTLKDIIKGKIKINLVRLDDEFTTKELDIGDDKACFITPVKTPKHANDKRDKEDIYNNEQGYDSGEDWDSNESDSDFWARLVSLLSMHSRVNGWDFIDDHHGSSLRSSIAGQLGLDDFRIASNNETEKISMLLRLKRELKDDDIFNLATQVIQFNSTVDEKQVEALCHRIEGKLK